MFGTLLEAVGLKRPSKDQLLREIVEEFLEAGYEEIVESAVKSDDRVANLAIIQKLLAGADGVVRSPEKALVWGQWALDKKRKIQYVEYVEKIIPNELAEDRKLRRDGRGKLLERANNGDAAAHFKLAEYYFEKARSLGGDILRYDDSDDPLLEGKAADALQRGVDWLARAAHLPGTSATIFHYLEIHKEVRKALLRRSRLRERPSYVSAVRDDDEDTAAEAKVIVRRANARREPFPSGPDFVTRRGINSYTQRVYFTHGFVEVLGGLLPKQGTFGGVGDVRFDGHFPQHIGTNGNRWRYKTDGHLQVFYRNPEAVGRYIWIAKSVDTYNLFN